MDIERCQICRPNHRTLYFHNDEHSIWIYCNKCHRAYSLYDYCAEAGLSLKEFLKENLTFEEAKPNEVRKMEWPQWFVSPFDSRAVKGMSYLAARMINPVSIDIFYDLDTEAIVFPYYYNGVFVGAQRRYVCPKVIEGKQHKMDTLPGTRLGLLTWNYDGHFLPSHIKAFVVTEGAFNAISLQQSLNEVYGGHLNNPYRCVAISGSSLSQYQSELFQEKKDLGYKIIMATDSDEAGLSCLKKASDRKVITHYSLTGEPDLDWNDVLVNKGTGTLIKIFLNNIQSL